MVQFVLMITATMENITNLQPQGGFNDPSFPYLFKLKCTQCGEVSQKETCLFLDNEIPLLFGKKNTHLIQKCKLCEREGTVTMIPGKGMPLTKEMSEAGKYAPLMAFDCGGYEPEGFVFGGKWKAESISGTKFEGIKLSGEEFHEYDEKGDCPVMISKCHSKFEPVK